MTKYFFTGTKKSAFNFASIYFLNMAFFSLKNIASLFSEPNQNSRRPVGLASVFARLEPRPMAHNNKNEDNYGKTFLKKQKI